MTDILDRVQELRIGAECPRTLQSCHMVGAATCESLVESVQTCIDEAASTGFGCMGAAIDSQGGNA